jgi:hypothetical protein
MPTHYAFGVEQEHFVFDKNHLPPTQEATNRLWDILVKDGYRVQGTSPDGMVLSVERQTDDGPLVITNDSCTHILETAFPKMDRIDRFRELYVGTWDYLRNQLAALDLSIQFGGSLNRAPREICWRPKETDSKGERLKKILMRKPIDHPLFCQSFPACFAATHVSLNIPAQEAIEKLPFFYSQEYKIPRDFSTSKEFQGVKGHCIRPLAWLANFHQPYPLLGIPETIPKTLDEYEQMQAECSGRDYSFVAIRDANRLEFRSACSQNTVDDVVRLVDFRLDCDKRAGHQSNVHRSSFAVAFENACDLSPESSFPRNKFHDNILKEA